jgi:hypothetical protein
MNMSKMRLITVIVDAQCERALSQKLGSWGIKDYTAVESRVSTQKAQGRSTSEVRRIRIEAAVNEAVSRRVIEGLQAESFSDGSISFFVSDVLTPASIGDEIRSSADSYMAPRRRWAEHLISM